MCSVSMVYGLVETYSLWERGKGKVLDMIARYTSTGRWSSLLKWIYGIYIKALLEIILIQPEVW